MNRATFRTTTAADLQIGDVIANDHTATANLYLWEVMAIDTVGDRTTMTLGDMGYAVTIEDTDTGRTLYAYGIAQPSPNFPVTVPADRIQHVFVPTAI